MRPALPVPRSGSRRGTGPGRRRVTRRATSPVMTGTVPDPGGREETQAKRPGDAAAITGASIRTALGREATAITHPDGTLTVTVAGFTRATDVHRALAPALRAATRVLRLGASTAAGAEHDVFVVTPAGVTAGTPDAGLARARLMAVDPRHRYHAALACAAGRTPRGDDESSSLHDLGSELNRRPERAFPSALAHAAGAPEWAARRARNAAVVAAALDGTEHDVPPHQVTALAEYARQLRAALAARGHGTAARDAETAAAIRSISGRVVPDGPTGNLSGAAGVRARLAEAAGSLDGGNLSWSWSCLDLARQEAAGAFGRHSAIVVLDDGTAAHEAVEGLMRRLVAAPPAAGTLADHLHAGDLLDTARDATSGEGFGVRHTPGEEAAAGQIRAASHALASGDRAMARELLAAAAAAEPSGSRRTPARHGDRPPPGPPRCPRIREAPGTRQLHRAGCRRPTHARPGPGRPAAAGPARPPRPMEAHGRRPPGP